MNTKFFVRTTVANSNQQMEATNVFLESTNICGRFQKVSRVAELAVNLEQMNKVYGNMLTAMNQSQNKY